jgi:hypothetical protein
VTGGIYPRFFRPRGSYIDNLREPVKHRGEKSSAISRKLMAAKSAARAHSKSHQLLFVNETSWISFWETLEIFSSANCIGSCKGTPAGVQEEPARRIPESERTASHSTLRTRPDSTRNLCAETQKSRAPLRTCSLARKTARVIRRSNRRTEECFKSNFK